MFLIINFRFRIYLEIQTVDRILFDTVVLNCRNLHGKVIHILVGCHKTRITVWAFTNRSTFWTTSAILVSWCATDSIIWTVVYLFVVFEANLLRNFIIWKLYKITIGKCYSNETSIDMGSSLPDDMTLWILTWNWRSPTKSEKVRGGSFSSPDTQLDCFLRGWKFWRKI